MRFSCEAPPPVAAVVKFAQLYGPLSPNCRRATFHGALLSSVVPMVKPCVWLGISPVESVCRASPPEFRSEYEFHCPSLPTQTTALPLADAKALQPVGHEPRLNAITAPDGTDFAKALAALFAAVVTEPLIEASSESTVQRSATILFHSPEASGDHDDAVPTCARIHQLAYAAQTARSATQKDSPITAPWRDF